MKLNPVELALVNNPLRSLLLRATVSRLHDAACAPPLERVLEIGCGVGAGVEEILRRFTVHPWEHMFAFPAFRPALAEEDFELRALHSRFLPGWHEGVAVRR